MQASTEIRPSVYITKKVIDPLINTFQLNANQSTYRVIRRILVIVGDTYLACVLLLKELKRI